MADDRAMRSQQARTRSTPEQRGWYWYDCYELADPVRNALAAAYVELLDQPGSAVSHLRDTSS
jgi:hypothetical protein